MLNEYKRLPSEGSELLDSGFSWARAASATSLATSCAGLGFFGFKGPAGLFGFEGLDILRIGLVRSRGGGAAEEDDGSAKGAGDRGGGCRCES